MTLKYITYTRKSTESEDRQILSLPAQKRELKEFAQKNNLHIVANFSEAASAYKTGRLEFDRMVQFIKANNADGIIVWQYNRLARNALDGGMIIHLLDTGVLKEIKTPTGSTDGTGNSKFMLQLEFAMSKKSSDDNSESVKRGNKEKMLRGWDIRRHLGYKFIDNPDTLEKILEPDEPRFSMLRQVFNMVLAYKPTGQALQVLNDEMGFRTPKTRRTGGRPLTTSNFYKILHEPFYAGWLTLPNGEIIKGKHQPLITDKEYQQVQTILAAKGRPRPKTLLLPFRGQMFCGECNCTVCLEEKHQCICTSCKTKFSSKNHDHCPQCHTKIDVMNDPTLLHYIYARCTHKKRHIHCQQKYSKLSDIEDQIMEFLESIELAPRLEEWVLKQLKKQLDKDLPVQDDTRRNLQRRLDRTQAELNSLLAEYTSPENANRELIEPEEYQARKIALKKSRKKIEDDLAKLLKNNDSLMDEAEEKFNFAVTARQKFYDGDFFKKTEIVAKLGSNLILKDGKITIQQEYPWLFIKKANKKLATLKAQGFEPEKSIDAYEKTGVVDEVISTLQGQEDSNLRQRFWRPLFYH